MFGISDYIAIITINRFILNTCGGAFTISINIWFHEILTTKQ